jgi:hypothetical protein
MKFEVQSEVHDELSTFGGFVASRTNVQWTMGLSLFVLGLVSCAHQVPRQPASPEAASETQRIADYFNRGLPTDNDQTNYVTVVGGRLLAVDAESKHVAGHFIEDCRKVALRQALLDVTSEGYEFVEFSRKGSHRQTSLIEDQSPGYESGRVDAFVGVRALNPQKEKVEMTYHYSLDDDSSGNCEWRRTENKMTGFQDRRVLEAQVLKEVWPKLPPERQASMRTWYKNRFGVGTDAEIAAKSVGKLIEWECEQFSMSKAVQVAQKEFRDEGGSQPIVLLDFEFSRVTSNITEDNRGPHKHDEKLGDFQGAWVLRMADALGTRFLSKKVSFKLREKGDKCVGTMGTTGETQTF